MICVKSLQLDLNRILLLAIGLWPYEQSKLVRAQLVLFYIILVTCIIFQLTVLMTTKCNSQLVIEVLSAVFFFIILIFIYNTFSFNMDVVKHLLEVLQCTYNELKDDGEVAIIKKYGTIAKSYTYALTLLCVIGLSIFMFFPFLPRVFNILLPVNESRASLPIITEYFVNQDKYFYLILLHVYIAFCIGLITLVAVGTMTITYWLYGCGMFQVASYRVEQSMTKSALKISDTFNYCLVYRRIIGAIEMHRKALMFVKYFLEQIEVFYFVLMSGIVIALSLNLYRVFDGLSSGVVIYKLMSPILFLITNYILMFLCNYCAQQVMDHYNLLFITAYNVPWYKTPLHIQKTILFLIQRSSKPFNLNLVGLMVASLENFAMLTSTSVSYFTVMYSMGP